MNNAKITLMSLKSRSLIQVTIGIITSSILNTQAIAMFSPSTANILSDHVEFSNSTEMLSTKENCNELEFVAIDMVKQDSSTKYQSSYNGAYSIQPTVENRPANNFSDKLYKPNGTGSSFENFQKAPPKTVQKKVPIKMPMRNDAQKKDK